jgi:hypothetical protein
MQIEVPVLVIAFNRPEVIEKTFDYIRKAQPVKLYVAVDGPRDHMAGESKLVERVRQIVEKVDWPCETFYKYNDRNLSAEKTVSSAIQWVFENEEYAIILEDDIIAPLSFFRFAQEMLIRYKDEERIATVTGSNFTPIPIPGGYDYFFAKYGHSWGWATWRRVWKDFDLNVVIPEKHLKKSFLKHICNSPSEVNYYRKIFRTMRQKGAGNSTWDVVDLYYHRINNRLSVIPRVNLTSNIGVYGLHARGKTEHHFRPSDENFMVRNHTDKKDCFTEYDKHHFDTYIINHTPIYKRIIRKLLKITGLS